MVRLKLDRVKKVFLDLISFNSTMVRLKRGDKRKEEGDRIVSIPQWFD